MAENIYSKLTKMRVELQRMNIKKSGHNDYSNYDYYELGDILPPINELQDQYKTCSIITFDNEKATLMMFNAEAPEEVVYFTSPMAELSLKAANPVQNLGGVETYQRRYLYMTAFEIVENDYFDATQGKEENKKTPPKPKAPKKPKPSQISEAKANELNLMIKKYSAMSGNTTQAIVNKITETVGKKISDMDDKDATTVLSLLNQWIEIFETGE